MIDVEGEPKLVGRGYYWQELTVGQRFRTFRRTVTESDVVNFVCLTGMLESIFIDTGFQHGAIKGRPAPAALVYGMIEGFIVQSMIQGTGLALLEMSQKVHAPVLVGDTIGATIELTELRPTSKSGRAVTTWSIEVHNQRGENVMSYTAKRLLAGHPDRSA
jgi:acyl dehydratase